MNIEASVQNKEVHSAKFQTLKEMSSSVPDITSKSQTSSPLLKDMPTFKVSFFFLCVCVCFSLTKCNVKYTIYKNLCKLSMHLLLLINFI